MKKIIEVRQKDPNITHVTWIINNICPNSCIYCPESTHNGSNHNYDWNNARRFVLMLLEKYPKMHLSISGGEPSSSPFLIELVNLFHDGGHTISIITNGYKSADYWREIAQYVTWIGFSYHPEFSNEQYFKNLEAAADITRCGAKVMMLSSHWDQCVKVYEKLNTSSKYVTTPTRIVEWGTRNGSDYYTDEQIKWFQTTMTDYNKMHQHSGKPYSQTEANYYLSDGTIDTTPVAALYINRGQTNFKGYECDIGLRSLFIGAFGQIKRGNCLAGGHIGTIDKPEKIIWPDKPIMCNYDLCSCGTDVNINKKSLGPEYQDTINYTELLRKKYSIKPKIDNSYNAILARLGHAVTISKK
jgi:organic radical activating enzyme